MRDYGKVHTSFWTSDDVRALSEDGRMLALYLLTSPHGTIIGAFRLPDAYVAEDMQWTHERVLKGFHELFRKGFATRDPVSKWVVIHRFLKRNGFENPNQGKAAAKLFESVTGDIAKRAIAKAFAEYATHVPTSVWEPFLKGSETVPEPYRNQDQDQDQDQDQEQEQEQEREAARAQRALLDVEAMVPPEAGPPRAPIQQQQHSTFSTEWVIAELRKYEPLASVANLDFASQISGRLLSHPRPVDVIVQAIADVAADSAGVGLKQEALAKKVRSYVDNARRMEPRGGAAPSVRTQAETFDEAAGRRATERILRSSQERKGW